MTVVAALPFRRAAASRSFAIAPHVLRRVRGHGARRADLDGPRRRPRRFAALAQWVHVPRAVKLVLLALSVAMLSACRDHDPHAHHAPPPPAPPASAPGAPANAVQHEMRLLTAALEGAVRGIGQGDVRAVEHDLHRVHAAKEATEAALKSGTYRPPLNPDKLDRFRELDESFHRDLERLVEASRRNDVAATAAATGVVLNGCQSCHAEFRK